MKSFEINENDSGQRLDKFITKSVPLLPKSLMYKYIRLKRIKVNGKKSDISAKLCIGDIVEMYINDEFFESTEKQYDFLKASKHLDIVYEDEYIVLLDKKIGLLPHPDEREYTDTLISRLIRYLYESGKYDPENENSFTPALVNRIDRNTRGIVIAAKNAEALRIMNLKMKEREIHKFYVCIVHGTPVKGKNMGDGWRLLEGWLSKDEEKNTVKVLPEYFKDSKEIKTKYRVIETRDKLSLLEIELLTGRTHQIRAHMASIGHPLLGDGKYGTNELNRQYGHKKQLLCSYKLEFDFKTNAGALEYLNGRSFEINDIWFIENF